MLKYKGIFARIDTNANQLFSSSIFSQKNPPKIKENGKCKDKIMQLRTLYIINNNDFEASITMICTTLFIYLFCLLIILLLIISKSLITQFAHHVMSKIQINSFPPNYL